MRTGAAVLWRVTPLLYQRALRQSLPLVSRAIASYALVKRPGLPLRDKSPLQLQWNPSGWRQPCISILRRNLHFLHGRSRDRLKSRFESLLSQFTISLRNQTTSRPMFSRGLGNMSQKSPSPPEYILKLDGSSRPLEVAIKGYPKTFYLVSSLLRYTVAMLLCLAAISLVIEEAIMQSHRGDRDVGSAFKVRRITEPNTVKLDDVKGCDEVKAEVQQIIEYLNNPQKFTSIGARLPRGILLCGPPGTGKTLLARAIAGEADVPVFEASGSEFEEMYVGVGAQRIRSLFKAARKVAPAIIFIDEIDAIGSERTQGENASNRMALNQLLTELDGFDQSQGIVVLCATNFEGCLDQALTRPGRLDRTIFVPIPDLKGREEILRLYAQKIKLHPSVDLTVLAQRTTGMTGADLFNLVNLAAIKSAVDGMQEVTMHALEEALDRVVVGSHRSTLLSQKEKEMTAYHEAGHALVAMLNKMTDPVHKVTIMPRGNALGVTWQIPEKDRYQETFAELEAKLAVLMGGKAAELLIYGRDSVTAGCASDLRVATQLAIRMVSQFGMGMESTNAPRTIDRKAILSQGTLEKYDAAIQNLLNTAFSRAHQCLTGHKQHLQNIAKALLEYETVTYSEIQLIMKGRAKDIPLERARKKEEDDRKSQARPSNDTTPEKVPTAPM